MRVCFVACMQPEGEDELKKMQLMELAIINGTFRTNEQVQAAQLAMAQKLQAVRKCDPTNPPLTHSCSYPHTLKHNPRLCTAFLSPPIRLKIIFQGR